MSTKFTILLFLLSGSIYAQTISSVIVDSQTNEPIPFATITVSAYNGVMSNEEGRFSISVEDPKPTDSLSVMCMGYQTLQLPVDKPVPDPIKLVENVFQTVPVFIETRALNAEDIVDKVKEGLNTNYEIDYQKAQIFSRNSGNDNIKRFKLTVKKSTVDGINQKTMDEFANSFNRNYVYLNETLSDAVFNGYNAGNYIPLRTLMIQSKEELASADKIQAKALQFVQESFKTDSRLIIRTGIIRLDKTESIDSIIKTMKSDIKAQKDTLVSTADETKKRAFIHDNFFLKKGSKIDFLLKSNRYRFVKEGYTTIDGSWVYILSFTPKGRAKFKGKLYINAEDFGIVKAEYQSARPVYNKLFNMFGVKANELSVRGSFIFKQIDGKYFLTYFNKLNVSEFGIDRPFDVIEKNSNVKGRKRINKLKFNLDIYGVNTNKTEVVFSNYRPVSKETFEGFKPTKDHIKKVLNAYDPSFWRGYNILTPEKAIEQIKVEE